MTAEREIRADYDSTTIVIYQAYSPAVADPALAAQRFVPPFSCGRMTWIKPSFLWLMERSSWGQKTGQERILAVRIKRTGWEEALSLGVLTDAEPRVYPNYADWEKRFAQAKVHIQWDPERSLRGNSLLYGSIQVGLSRHIIQRYVEEWTVSIEDLTSKVKKIATLIRTGGECKVKNLMPPERIYPLTAELKQSIGTR